MSSLLSHQPKEQNRAKKIMRIGGPTRLDKVTMLAYFQDKMQRVTQKVGHKTESYWDYENVIRSHHNQVQTPTASEMNTARNSLQEAIAQVSGKTLQVIMGEYVLEVNIGDHLRACYEEALHDMTRPGYGMYVGQEYGKVEHFVDSMVTDLPLYMYHALWGHLMHASEKGNLCDEMGRLEVQGVADTYLSAMLEDFAVLKMVPIKGSDTKVVRAYYERSAGFAEGSRDFLGQGGFGEVFLATVYRKDDIQEVVVKRANEDGYNALLNELAVLLDFQQHKDAAKYLVGFEGVSYGATYLAMEQLEPLDRYAEAFLVDQYEDHELEDIQYFFDEDTLGQLFDDLEKGLRYIHGMGYAHGDIKPHNIGLSIEDSRPKFMDLGGMVQKDVIDKQDIASRVGLTSGYGFTKVMDEVINSGEITLMQEMDWFALGRVFHEITSMGMRIQEKLGLEKYSDSFLGELNQQIEGWTTPMEPYIYDNERSATISRGLFYLDDDNVPEEDLFDLFIDGGTFDDIHYT